MSAVRNKGDGRLEEHGRETARMARKAPTSPRETLERNLKRAQGRMRNARASTMISGRQYAIAVESTVITFECERAKHVYKIDFASKRRRLTARLSPQATKFHASWWSREKGGCIGECPKCTKDNTP